MATILSGLTRWFVWAVISFVLIVIAFALLDDLPAKLSAARKEATSLQQVAINLDSAKGPYDRAARQQLAAADKILSDVRNSSNEQLKKAERDLRNQKNEAQTRVLDRQGLALAALTGQADRIQASYFAAYVEIPLSDRALKLINVRRENFLRRAKHAKLVATLDARTTAHNRNVNEYNRESRRRDQLQRTAEAEFRNPLCRRVALPYACKTVRQWRAIDEELKARKGRLVRESAWLVQQRRVVGALRQASEAVARGDLIIQEASAAFASEAASVSEQAERKQWNTGSEWLDRYGPRAFWTVALVALLPVLHKLFAFLFIAPFASRAKPIQLEASRPSMRAGESRTSVDVPLDADTELFIRDGVQSASSDIGGQSIALLDWWMPMTCLAAGLFGLQRLRTTRPDYVSVTAVDDEHYEVALIDVPVNGAVTLQPRALVGLSKRRSDRLVITRPWRLNNLASWITFQFRFVVFHGPCTLVVQGRRGVRVEDAQRVRMINRRLTIGFDAALAYGAARSTAFFPYLRGQQSLFNDRFGGSGFYLYEQRAAGTGKGGLWGRGLKGLGDAILSAFGV